MLRDLVIEITEGQVSFFLVTVVRKDCVAQTDDGPPGDKSAPLLRGEVVGRVEARETLRAVDSELRSRETALVKILGY